MPPLRAAVATTLALSLLAGTSSLVLAEDAVGPLTVYSGRSESLVGPVLESFTEATGIEVVTKYADTAELVAILLEEGGRSPADVFFAQDAGALGAVADSALLARLPDELLARVSPGFSDPGGEWVGVSGRARTAAYTTTEDLDIPDSILGFTDPAWSGRIGWAPANGSFQAFVTALRVANGSFQAFVTALRVIEGEEGARAWLEGILANEPVAYPKNTAAVEGVAAGEVDVAFVNHYYLLRLLAEHGEDYPVAQAFFTGGDAGSLVNVAGVGQLVSSDQPDASAALVAYLLEDEAQRYFSEATFEFPLIEGIRSDPRLPDFGSIEAPDVDLSALADLQGTVQLLREVGAID